MQNKFIKLQLVDDELIRRQQNLRIANTTYENNEQLWATWHI